MGFICTHGASPQASACAAWARPISPPSSVTNELFDMFCALNGATRRPRRCSNAHSAVATQLLPAFDDVPRIEIAFMPKQRLGFRALARRETGCFQRAFEPRTGDAYHGAP